MLDFEVGLHKAANQIFPEAILRGCHFHLAQNWWKKIQSSGLVPSYRSDSDAGKWLRRCFGLPALDSDLVEECFAFELMPSAPEEVIQFADYLLETYVQPASTFPPSMWAGLATCGLKTTNNGCESFHRHFGDLFRSPNPNIFDFLEHLKEIHTYNSIKLRSTNSRHKKGNNHAELHQQLRAKELTMGDFLAAVSKNMLPPSL